MENKFGDIETGLIAKARQFATKAHEGQTRKYGDEPPYITHPEVVAEMVYNVPDSTAKMVAAAWLHDVVEDTDITIEEINREFGDSIGTLVEELTNPSKKYPNFKRHERKRIDRDHTKTISNEAKTIKLADRIHNLTGILAEAPEDFAWTYLCETNRLWRYLEGGDRDLSDRLWDIIITALEENS